MKKRILVVAPHPDDETLGAGGAIAKYVEDGHQVSILTVSGHLPPLYSRADYEKTVKEASKAFAILGVSNSWFLEIPATMIGELPVGDLNKKIVDVLSEFEPQIVLCPFPDRHIDHRVVFESVMVATRPVAIGRCVELLAAYETLSETHWNAPHIEPNFMPNWVINISSQIDRKIHALGCYESQIPPFPGSRSLDAVKALAMFRGTQAGFAYGEAFQIIRMIG
jgi:LmbE family N-acetylglucosaminyl deacetylase